MGEHDSTWYGISLQSFQISCLTCIPSQTFAHPPHTHWGSRVRNKENFDAVQALFNSSQNIDVLPILFCLEI